MVEKIRYCLPNFLTWNFLMSKGTIITPTKLSCPQEILNFFVTHDHELTFSEITGTIHTQNISKETYTEWQLHSLLRTCVLFAETRWRIKGVRGWNPLFKNIVNFVRNLSKNWREIAWIPSFTWLYLKKKLPYSKSLDPLECKSIKCLTFLVTNWGLKG